MRIIHKILFLCLLFFPYAIKIEAKQKLAIFTYYMPGDVTWDPDSIKTGITGSEEAVIYISKQLADLGYEVTVFGNPPRGSSYSSQGKNPLFVSVDRFNPKDIYDIAIVWRSPALGNEIKGSAKKLYFWPHDHAYPMMLDKEQVDAFDDVLWLSNWQRKQWIAKHPLFAQFTHIFGNGINPEQHKGQEKKKNPYSCIYGSNYGRGLDVLLDAWPDVKARFPKATLDIYYGWKHWGLLTKEKEEKMRRQVASLKALDVREHGLVGHEELNQAYLNSAFWTYPCTGIETFCITALKAQMAGAIPVILEGSALAETVANGYKCSRVEEYKKLLMQAMESVDDKQSMRQEAKNFVLENYTWKKVALKWKEVFDADLNKGEGK